MARRCLSSGSGDDGEQLNVQTLPTPELVDAIIQADTVVVFSKTTCGYSTMAKRVLQDNDVKFSVFELDGRADAYAMQKHLGVLTGATTVPRVFIGGECVGGGSEVRDLAKKDMLKPLVEKALQASAPAPEPAAAPSSSATTEWPSVCIVGVGQLGAAVASNLLRHGVDLTLFDLQGADNVPTELAPLLADATWASSAREAAAGAEVVITALPAPQHVTAAFAGDDGILAGIRPGATWIEHSTTDFENTDVVRAKVEAAGAHAVEAPVTGGMQILREGKMVTLVGAAPAVLEAPSPISSAPATIADLISLSAPRIVRCGQFGHATIIKIFSNILCAAHDVAIGETLCTAKKAGLDLQLVFDAMRLSSGNSFCWETEVPRMLKGDFYPDFTAEMMHKDISLGLDLGEKFGVPMPMNQFIADKYEEAMAAYGKGSGSSIPCKLVEDASGCRLIDEGTGSAEDTFPGNLISEDSHNGAFKDWSYTTEVLQGSYTVLHTGYDNVFTQAPFANKEDEIAALRERLAVLEAE